MFFFSFNSTLGTRTLQCDFNFSNEQDVLPTIYNIFGQFNDVNNKLDDLVISFGQNSMANFVFNGKTTGRLQVDRVNIKDFCDDEGRGTEMFTDTAWDKSQASLESIEIIPFCEELLVFAPGFLAGLVNLKKLQLHMYDYDSQPFSEEGFPSLESLDLFGHFSLSSWTSDTFPPMPKLKHLGLYFLQFSSFEYGCFDSFPNLIDFISVGGEIEELNGDIFPSSIRHITLPVNKITSANLTGLHPDTVVELQINAITEIKEENFRPFIESILATADGKGVVVLNDNPLVCSCDIKWVITELNAAHLFPVAECIDGTLLIDVDEEYINQHCPE